MKLCLQLKKQGGLKSKENTMFNKKLNSRYFYTN